MNPSLLSSKKMDYCTPQDFFNKLDQEFHFTLDAAATPKSAKCRRYYTPADNGLEMPWSCGGGGILQSAIWAGDRKVGPQSVGGGAKRNNHRSADSGKNRYNIFSQLHIRTGRNPICAGEIALYRRGRDSLSNSTIPVHGGHLQRKERTA